MPSGEMELLRKANEVELLKEANSLEAKRRRASIKITDHADRMIDELMLIIYSEDVDARIKLSAISMLLDRAVPRLGVQQVSVLEEDEAPAKRGLREDIESLIKKQMKEV